MSVLRRAYVEVEPDVTGFDNTLKTKLARQDPGGKAGKQVGGQLNRALKRFDLDPIDVKADPKSALAGIAVAEAKLRELSGSAATVEVKVQTERALKQLGSFRKQIGDVGGDAAPDFALSFSQRLGPLLAKLPISGPLGIGLAAAAAAAAPLLGAAVAGGIIGGVGIGGVVGGLALAAKDQRVQAAADDLGDRLEHRLMRAGGAFVDPAIAGIKEIQRAADDIDIERIFAESAQFVQPLTVGVASAITDIGHALEDLVDNAGPPVQAISDGIALIGKEAAEGLSSLSDNAEAGADALRILSQVVSLSITSTFQLVNVLTELYEINREIGGDTGLRVLLKLTGQAMDDTAESARKTGSGTFGMSEKMIEAGRSADELKEKQALLKGVQDAVKVSQDALQGSLNSLGGATSLQAQRADALRTAMDNLYGASIRQTDANESYQASWDDLSESVKNNKATLDINSVAGRANRDVLQGLLTKNNELYLANINAGESIDSARKKHVDRTAAVKEEARRLGLNKDETNKLIETYGKIPPKKTTDLVLSGISSVADALLDLAAVQLHLAKGTPLGGDLARRLARVQYGMPDTKRAHGGPLPGHAPHDRADNMVYAGTPGEWVIQKPTVRKVERAFGPGAMSYFNQYGELPAFASGGLVEASRANWGRGVRFDTNLSKTRIPSMAEAVSKVAGGRVGAAASFIRAQAGKPYMWAAAGPHGYDCSGIVSAAYNILKGRNPYSHTFSTGSLPGGFFDQGSRSGPLLAGWSHPGQAPASASVGHMAGQIAGMPFESRGSRGVVVGSAARKVGQFASVGAAKFDNGGYLMPGWNPPIYNGTGRPEPVTPAGDMDRVVEVLEALLRAVGDVGPEVGDTLARALLGTVPATRVAARQAGRRPART